MCSLLIKNQRMTELSLMPSELGELTDIHRNFTSGKTEKNFHFWIIEMLYILFFSKNYVQSKSV